MWAEIGLALAVGTALFAAFRSLRAKRNFYAADVYGMTARSDRAYALIGTAFALLFLAAIFVRGLPTVPLLAAYVLIAIFYFSSFARGFSDEE